MMTAERVRALSEDFLAWADHYRQGLYDWQREAFGGATRRGGGRFRYRLAGVSTPRGNGKTAGGAKVGSWRFRLGPQPQLILSCALDYEGARVCLDHAKATLRSHPESRTASSFWRMSCAFLRRARAGSFARGTI